MNQVLCGEQPTLTVWALVRSKESNNAVRRKQGIKDGNLSGLHQQIRCYVTLICGEVNTGDDLKEIIWGVSRRELKTVGILSMFTWYQACLTRALSNDN